MTTVATNNNSQKLSKEQVEAMLDQMRGMPEEQQKEFLLAHRELFAAVKPRDLFFDEVVVKGPRL